MLIKLQSSPEKVEANRRLNSLISSQYRILQLKERSLLEESSFPTKSEEQLICLFFKSRFDININVNDVPSFINFNFVCKNDLLDVIYNYFFVYQNKMIEEDIKFVFNDKDVRSFFNFGILSREDLYDFVFSLTEKVIEYSDDVSYKGNNKIS